VKEQVPQWLTPLRDFFLIRRELQRQVESHGIDLEAASIKFRDFSQKLRFALTRRP
jgi:hypothetical protein